LLKERHSGERNALANARAPSGEEGKKTRVRK